MPTTVVRDLNVLALYVSDLARSRTFYQDHLGFEFCGDMDPGILMKAGPVTLYLEASRSAGRTEHTTAGFSPCFATDSVKASFRDLKAAGVPISMEYQEFGPSFALFRISDPDGNSIEFAGAP